MVSAPNYDPLNKPEDIDTDESGLYEGIYLNRAISGVFTPGSTFKVVTAIAAIENLPDVYEKSFYCNGRYTTGKGSGDGDGLGAGINVVFFVSLYRNFVFRISISVHVTKNAFAVLVDDEVKSGNA